MNYLREERDTLERYMPSMDAQLQEIPLLKMEAPGNPSIRIFRDLRGPGLLVPAAYGGAGITPLEMARIQRALGSRSPSLALATNMHTCTVSAVPACPATAGLLRAIAEKNLYLASGFAEGRPSQSILTPNMQVRRTPDGVILSGSKKPCSLSESMDFFTASIRVPTDVGGSELALVTIPREAPGIQIRPFGHGYVLGGAENNEVVLADVEVPEEFISYFGRIEELNAALSKAFLWFELFVSASYLGAADGLVERVFATGRGNASERMQLAIESEGAMTALEGVAHVIMAGRLDEYAVAKALCVRYAVQRSIERISAHAAELLGGVHYLSRREIPYLLTVSRALAFHPPGRLVMAEPFDAYLKGNQLTIP